jgi:cystathionine beta-synthase
MSVKRNNTLGSFMQKQQNGFTDPLEVRTAIQAIGNTPMVRLSRMFPGTNAVVLAKLEFLNPSGSIKDRIARYIIEDAEREHLLAPGDTLVEATSGNTGAAIAMIAAMKGYRAILTMPEKTSEEKKAAARAFGAQVIICPSNIKPGDPNHYMRRAREIAEATPGSFFVNQYDNPKNIEAHYTTGLEIWRQAGGRVDFFVSGASTGGTVSGVGRYLKKQNPSIRIIVPDPIGSVYYSAFHNRKQDMSKLGNYKIEGIGKDGVSGCVDFGLIDDVIQVSDDDAFDAAKRLAKTEGLLVGGSSGANIWACAKIAEKASCPVVIVTTLPDSGLKYMSKIYSDL